MPEHKTQSTFPRREEAILQFWKERAIFEKSLALPAPKGDFVFYDGPPFATGTPHYGHIVASTIKDVVPRFATMRGYHVDRVWGWDCHGLPIENIVEKEMKIETKKDIETLGVEKFNAACRSTVLRYENEWKQFIPRMGRWVDMEHPYMTMDTKYMESLWWVFKTLYDRGLIYEGRKSMHMCPRCETTLSNFEVTLNYQETEDVSVVIKSRLLGEVEPVYLLAWTTTPWTIPGNVALAVGSDIKYAKVKSGSDFYILAQSRIETIFANQPYEVVGEVQAAQLIGRAYEPMVDFFVGKDLPNADTLFTVVAGDFVSEQDGTGMVHIAPAFGEDDMRLGAEQGLSFIQHVTPAGVFTSDMRDWAGTPVKPKDNPRRTDEMVVEFLRAQGKVFASQAYVHSYPFCWRCDTPLLNYAASSWFVKVTTVKEQMLANNEKINWRPEHVKHGRFGKWLEGARDWAISRNRYWGTPLPVWKCADPGCGDVKVIGSIVELRECIAQNAPDVIDLHRPYIDELEFVCGACGKGMMERIPEVFDCWFESGSMPYAQLHYPFENQEKFERGFPADFISEGIDQTRGWFYTLTVLASALFDQPAFKNCVINGIVLAEDGNKMSKRFNNYSDPELLVNKFGADSLRYYLLTSPVMKGEDIRFVEKGVEEVYKKFVLILLNVLSFYTMYAPQKKVGGHAGEPKNILDAWIVARLHELGRAVTDAMEQYDFVDATKPFLDFASDLSTWYVRRSRDRFKGDDEADKQAALTTLHTVLLELAKLLAPFTPFMAEEIYQGIREKGAKESVHLEEWPESDGSLVDESLLTQMARARALVSLALEQRAKAQIPVRQVLAKLQVPESQYLGNPDLGAVVADEVNVQEVVFVKGLAEVTLDTALTPELRELGLVRELTRHVNALRKSAGLRISDRVEVYFETESDALKQVIGKFEKELAHDTLSTRISFGTVEVPQERQAKVKLQDNDLLIQLK